MSFKKYTRNCCKESPEPICGSVKGKIPDWLKGSLVRNGGGLIEVGPDKYNHLFDGLALLHKFDISNGQVTYRNRFLRSDTYLRNMKAQRIVISAFGTHAQPDPCQTLYQRFMSLFSTTELTDNDLVNIAKYADDIYALTETNFIRKVDMQTLETLNKVDISKYLAVNTATAHPHYGTDGSVYNIGSRFSGGRPSFNIIKFPAKPRDEDMFVNASVVCSFPSRYKFHFNYYHSFGMTENYVIFVEQPLMFSLPKMALSGYIKSSLSDNLHFYNNTKAYFHVVNLKTGEKLATNYAAEPFLLFHHINAYEEDDHIVVDMCCYTSDDVFKSKLANGLKDVEETSCAARRYVLPLEIPASEKASPTDNLVKLKEKEAKAFLKPDGTVFCHYEFLTPAEDFVEFPTINYQAYNTKPYRYFYVFARNPSVGLMKVDTKNKTTKQWNEPNASPSEGIFVQTPGSTVEDDGVLLFSVLYDNNESKVSLVILDAETFTEISRADFVTESTVPADFHGMFVEQ